MISQERLKELLDYDPATGWFRWRVKLWGSARIGDIAGSPLKGRYVQIKIDGWPYKAHRLAFLWMTGKFPERGVDHVDGNGMNNAWHNLREATSQQQAANRRRSRYNKSGFKGVTWNGSSYQAAIQVRRRTIRLGYFPTPEAAHAMYVFAACWYFGEFMNDGK